MLRIVWDARSTVCRTASAKLSGDRPDSSMNFTTAIVPSLIARAGYGLPEIAGMQLGAGVVQGNEFRLTDLDGGGCRWRFWMCSEDLDPQRLCDPAPKCHCSVQEMLLGARWGASQSNPLT